MYKLQAIALIFFSFGVTSNMPNTCFKATERRALVEAAQQTEASPVPSVQIGTQTWMKSNLATTKYRDGSPIKTGLSKAAWTKARTGATAVYHNDPSNRKVYGAIYNWYAVADPRGLCPVGWHVPTQQEWRTLEDYLGGAQEAGGKLKAVSNLWQQPNTGATDESGFSALPAGTRDYTGTYRSKGEIAYFWTATEDVECCAYLRFIENNKAYFNKNLFGSGKTGGLSVRCIKDE